MSDEITTEKLEEMMQKADLNDDKETAYKLIQMYEDGDSRIPEEFINEMKERFGEGDAKPEAKGNDTEKSPSEAPLESAEDSSNLSYKESITTYHKNWKTGVYTKKLVSDLLLAEHDPYALWQVARMYRDSGSLEKAISAYESAYSIFKSCLFTPEITTDAFNLMIELGESYNAAGQTDKASAIYENAMEIMPEDPTSEDIAKLLTIFSKNTGIEEDKKAVIIAKAQKQALTGKTTFPIAFRLMTDCWKSNDVLTAQGIAEKMIQNAGNPEQKAYAEFALSAMKNNPIDMPDGISGAYCTITKALFANDSVQFSEINEAAEEADKLSGGVIGPNWKPLSDKIAAAKEEEEQKAREKEKEAANAQQKLMEEEAARQEKLRQEEKLERDKKEKEKHQRQIKRYSVIGVIVFAVIILISILANRPSKVDPFDYITISPTGINGYGYVETSINYDQMSSDLDQTVTKQNITVSVTPDSELKNGDTLKVTVSESGLNKVKLTKTSEEIPVADLPDGTAVDAFKDLDVTFDGIEGSGTVSIKNNSSDPMLQEATYDSDKSSGSLKTGDVVTITIHISDKTISKYKEYPQETTKTYTVGELGDYVKTINEISDDSFNKLVNDEQEIATAKLQSDGLYYAFGMDDYYGSNRQNMDSIEFVTAYLASGNDGERLTIQKSDDSSNDEENPKPYNRLILIYQVTAANSEGKQHSTCIKMIVNNILVANGNIIKYTKEDPEFGGYLEVSNNSYMTEDELYNKYVAQYKVTELNTVTQR